MTKVIRLLAILAAGAALAGCSEDVPSDDVATDAIYANLFVSAPGDGTSIVSASLRVGGSNSNTYLDLTDYDALMAFVNDTSKGMSQSGNGYSTTFPYEAEDTPYRIAFLRTPPPDGECAGVSAPNSTVSLPAPFSITGPLQDEVVPRSSALSLTWAGSGEVDAMAFSVDGTCIQHYADDIASDNGSFTIPADTIMVVGSANVSCTATVSITRSRDGDLDENYGEGGTITARQSRSIQFQTVQ